MGGGVCIKLSRHQRPSGQHSFGRLLGRHRNVCSHQPETEGPAAEAVHELQQFVTVSRNFLKPTDFKLYVKASKAISKGTNSRTYCLLIRTKLYIVIAINVTSLEELSFVNIPSCHAIKPILDWTINIYAAVLFEHIPCSSPQRLRSNAMYRASAGVQSVIL